LKIDHLALVVTDLDQALKLFLTALGGQIKSRERIEAKKIEVSFVEVGGTSFEIIAPWGPGTNFYEYLVAHGPGFHHVAFAVPDLEGVMGSLLEVGVHPDGPPVGDKRVVQWLRPEDTLGAVMQLIYRKP
jgi:methylmalonyl-CoA epimerase